jgi:aminopeptidase N
MRRRLAAPVALVLLATGVAGCTVSDDRPSSTVGPAVEAPADGQPPAGDSLESDPGSPAYRVARSDPREDSYYPDVGEPGFDALHYDLHLSWDPDAEHLDASAAIAFRATESAEQLQLDLAPQLDVASVELDGAEVDHRHVGKDLVVEAAVREDAEHVLSVTYSGTPAPTAAPSQRSDIATTGWTTTPEGEAWTMQEPYGAHTWYPVNDHPSDKARYSFRISAPEEWVGVANGELLSREVVDGRTVTEWHMDAPASSYLVTVAIGDLVMTEDEAASGLPLTYWTPEGDETALRRLEFTPEAVDWLEERLGPFPFDSLGSVVVDSQSAMETQTMITYGNTSYTLSENVIVHEIAHQWYGDVVSPTDWSDLWMNEGMALYLAEGVFAAEQSGSDLDRVMDTWARAERDMRREAGPPGAYDKRMFGDSNVYYGPALMWHELRGRLGEERFWDLVRTWPTVHAHGGATRQQFLAWIEQETGEELSGFFRAWLDGRKQPPRRR